MLTATQGEDVQFFIGHRRPGDMTGKLGCEPDTSVGVVTRPLAERHSALGGLAHARGTVSGTPFGSRFALAPTVGAFGGQP